MIRDEFLKKEMRNIERDEMRGKSPPLRIYKFLGGPRETLYYARGMAIGVFFLVLVVGLLKTVYTNPQITSAVVSNLTNLTP